MRTFLIVWMLAVSVSLLAQEPGEPAEQPQEVVRKVIRVEHADVEQLQSVLGVFGVPMSYDVELGVIAVRGRADMVALLEEAIRRLDVPPPPQKNVELTAYLLLARKTPNGDDLLEELAGVRREVEKLLGYRSFELWDAVVLRTREGGEGVVRAVSDLYDLQVREIRVSKGDGGPVIRLDGLAVHVTNQLDSEKPGASFRTDVEVPEGKKVVVGKANMGGSDAALIVVITARLVS